MHSLYGSLFLWLNKNLCIVFIYKNRKKVMHLSDYLLAYPFVTKPFSINLHAFHYNMFAHAKSKLYRLKSLIFTNSYYMTNLFYPGDLTNFYHSHLIIPLLLFFLFFFKISFFTNYYNAFVTFAFSFFFPKVRHMRT